MNLNRFPEIETKRLLLRKIEVSDVEDVLFLRTSEIVNEFIERPENRKTKNLSDAIRFINEINEAFENAQSITWGITMNNNPKIIGSICLWNFSVNNKIAEVGYDLNPEFHGMGLMSEALKNVVGFGFKNLKLSRIEAFTHKNNHSSKKLLIKNEFQWDLNRTDSENSSNQIFEIRNPDLL